MAALSGISDLSLFKRRSSGAAELEALLDLLPQSTLIANEQSGRILYANAKATQLGAYTRKEFAELELNTLLPALASSRITEILSAGSDPGLYKLITRSSKSVEVSLAVARLGGPEHWIALTLQPASARKESKARQKREKERWEALHLLTLASQQNELSSSFRQILQAGHLLTGATHLALYTQAEEGNLSLEAVWGSGLDFPARLKEAEFAHLREPRVWQIGKPIESPLHKLAHAQSLSFLATTPLDLTHPGNGLLLAADELIPAPEEMLTQLQILAASTATSMLHTHTTIELNARIKGLGQSNQLSRALQEHVPDGLLFLNAELAIEEINPAAEILLGYTANEALGRAAKDILIGSPSPLDAFVQAFQKRQFVDFGETKLHHRDGSDFLAELRIIPVLEDDRVERVAVLIKDMSEQEALSLRSQQLQQRAWLGEVTAIFAHEVRNPINNISTGLQLMQLNLPEDHPMQEQIQRLQEDCDRLEHRMKSVLSFSRSLEHNPEDLDIGEFCRMQLERWGARMARHNIEHHLHVAANIPAILGDRRALEQVFTNLITNAIQAMQGQESGILAIKIEPSNDAGKDEYVDIRISDNGPGIPEDLKKRVFDPFFTTKQNEGTGLGLAITRRIVMAHKGEISLESFPGGTHFKITLPAATGAKKQGQEVE